MKLVAKLATNDAPAPTRQYRIRQSLRLLARVVVGTICEPCASEHFPKHDLFGCGTYRHEDLSALLDCTVRTNGCHDGDNNNCTQEHNRKRKVTAAAARSDNAHGHAVDCACSSLAQNSLLLSYRCCIIGGLNMSRWRIFQKKSVLAPICRFVNAKPFLRFAPANKTGRVNSGNQRRRSGTHQTTTEPYYFTEPVPRT